MIRAIRRKHTSGATMRLHRRWSSGFPGCFFVAIFLFTSIVIASLESTEVDLPEKPQTPKNVLGVLIEQQQLFPLPHQPRQLRENRELLSPDGGVAQQSDSSNEASGLNTFDQVLRDGSKSK